MSYELLAMEKGSELTGRYLGILGDLGHQSPWATRRYADVIPEILQVVFLS